jgi:prevent-host-death family protein
MTTQQINVYEAKTQLSKLIERVENGEDIVIARAGKPAVRLVKWSEPQERVPGAWRGRMAIHDDFDDFTDQDARDWYGE